MTNSHVPQKQIQPTADWIVSLTSVLRHSLESQPGIKLMIPLPLGAVDQCPPPCPVLQTHLYWAGTGICSYH